MALYKSVYYYYALVAEHAAVGLDCCLQLFLQASSAARWRDPAAVAVSSEPFVRALRMTRYIHADRLYVWHVCVNYENVATLVRRSSHTHTHTHTHTRLTAIFPGLPR